MAKIAAHGSRVWLDESALAAYLTSSEFGVDQETPDVTTFADAGPRRVVGNYMHAGSLNGFFDGDNDSFDELASVDLKTDEDHYLLQTPGASSEGTKCYERVVRLKSQPRSSKVGQAVLLNLEDEGCGPIVRATILRSGTVTGTGNGTGQNLGATTGETVVVTYRVLAVSGTGSIVLQCQESQNDGSPDTYASIAALASGTLSGVGVTRKTTTGNTEAWKRISVATFSGFTSATVLVTYGVAPNTP